MNNQQWDYVLAILIVLSIAFLIVVVVGDMISPCFGENNCVVTTVHTGSQITRTVYQP